VKDQLRRLRLGSLGQNLLHLGGVERAHRLRADVAEHVRCQQHTGGRLIVRGLEDTHAVKCLRLRHQVLRDRAVR
jgi:predicted TIM-barrel enzyme